MERKLATIETVKELKPIPDADLIELAIVRGWQCVVKKGEFKPGDKGVYFEVDSFLPLDDKYEFLKKTSYKQMREEYGYRLKTCKFRGQISQGLFLPLKQFDELKDMVFDIGDDVTKELNIKLYEPPIPAHLAGEVKGAFPTFLRKSDQERIQNLLHYFEKYKND